MIKVESNGEAVDRGAPVNSRNDFARLCSLMPERADVGILVPGIEKTLWDGKSRMGV